VCLWFGDYPIHHLAVNKLKGILIAVLTTFVACSDPAVETKEQAQVLDGWEITTHPHGLDLNSRDLLFLDANTGFVVGFNGAIFKTTDRGETWQKKDSNTNLHLYSVSFVDLQKGFIAGHAMNCIDGDCGRGAIFLTTADGGESWTKRFFPEYIGFEDIHFFDDMHGIAMITIPAPMSTSDYIIGRTENGGQSWTLSEVPVVMHSKFHVVDGVAFAEGNQLILKISDAGETWENIQIPMAVQDGIRRIYFYNENIGYVDGFSQLYRTTDGGMHWNTSDLPFESLTVFHSYNEHESFNIEAVMRYEGGEFPQFKGSICERTTDGGQTWQTSEISEVLMLGLTVFPRRDLGYSINGRDFYTIARKP
jgi:photosystem II stability/assembly factor-like uncharacterized protein